MKEADLTPTFTFYKNIIQQSGVKVWDLDIASSFYNYKRIIQYL
jgi:hypothetical protein